MVRAAINNLAQAGLVTIDPASPARTVQMHASVQAAVRAYLPPADLEQVVTAAADALLETWPDGEGQGVQEAGRPSSDRPSPGRPRTGQALGLRLGAAGLRLGAAGHRRRDTVEAGGSSAAVPRRAVAGAQPDCPARPSRTGSRWWPQAPGCSARPTPTPWWPGTGSPRRMSRPGSPPTPSRCSRPRSRTGSRTRGPSTPRPSRPAPTWPAPTSPLAGPTTPSPCTSARWPTPGGCSARPTRSPWTPGPAWPRRTRRREGPPMRSPPTS